MKTTLNKNKAEILDPRNKTITLNLYNYSKVNSIYDAIILDFLSSIFSSRTDELDETHFKLETTKLYSPRFNIRTSNFKNYNIMRFEVKFIDPKVLSDVDDVKIIKLFNEYINQKTVASEDFNITKKKYINYLNYFKTAYDELADRYIEDLTFQNQLATFEQEEEFIKNLTIEKLNDYIKQIDVEEQFEISISKDIVDYNITTKNLDTQVERFTVNKFEDTTYDFNNDQASIKILYHYENIDHTTMQLFNLIYGGDVSSKLFTVVREEKKYAYSVYSKLFEKQAIYISIETQTKNIVNAITAINEQLEDMKNITEEQLQNAKETFISKLKLQYSKNYSIRTAIEQQFYFGSDYELENKIKEIKSINLEDLNKIKSKLEYFGKVIVK